MFNENGLLVYNLQFFAKDGPGGEKTEKPTSKKLSDARDEGKVAKSREVSNALGLIALFLILKVLIGTFGNQFLETFNGIYSKIPDVVSYSAGGISVATVTSVINTVLIRILTILLPVLLVGFAVAFASDIIQVKWKVTLKPLQPKFSKLNPISGFKKIFSKEALFELLKSLIKIGIVCWIAYSTLRDEFHNIFFLYDMPLKQAIVFIGDLAISIGLSISLTYVLIALADFVYQKLRFNEDMMMTKQEVKDEYKNTEGNPEIKSKQRARMREVSQRRMMQDLKTADVVITNPTHYAVAVKYDQNESSAPVVVAKGEDYLAAKIKEAAKENEIEIVENKPLARMLYANVDIGAQIPPELYQMVAEVLAYVYNIQGKI